jgi:hypothetical protein
VIWAAVAMGVIPFFTGWAGGDLFLKVAGGVGKSGSGVCGASRLGAS